MFRLRVACASSIAGLLLLHTPGHGQAPVSGYLIGQYAPPPIDRGLLLGEKRSPGSPESRLRAAIRTRRSAEQRVGRSGARYRAGRLIVKFRDGTLPAAQASALSAMSATHAARPAYADFDVVAIETAADAEAVARQLAAWPDVEYAQPAYLASTRLVPNDPLFARQWNLSAIDLPRAWDIQPAAGSEITVAVLDTGVAFTNVTMGYRAGPFQLVFSPEPALVGAGGLAYPALGDLRLSFVAATDLAPSSRFVAPRDFIWDTTLPLDLDGHGTHVAGTIGQTTNNGAGPAGVAYNVRLMPVKVINTIWDDIFGSPHEGTDDVVARGIRYAADNGAKVINMSIGRDGPPAPVVEDAMRYAICAQPKSSSCSGQGAFIAVAGGNDFQKGNPTQVFAEIASRLQGVVSVGAINPAKGHASYSSTGPWLELVAPGGAFGAFGNDGGILQQTLDLDLVDTFELSPSRFSAPRFDSLAYYFFAGTSQATAHVSGVAALLVQQGITDPAAVEAALERLATPCSEGRNLCEGSIAANRSSTFGFGLVQARGALRGFGLAR